MSATGLCRNRNWPSIECVECGQHSTMGNFVLPGMLYTLSSSVQSSPQSACLPMVPQLFPFDWAKKCARGTFLLPLFPARSSFSLFSALDTLFGVPGQRRRALCGHHLRLGCVYCAICLSAFAFMDNDDHYAMSMPMPMSMRMLMMMLLAEKLEAGELNVWVRMWCGALRTLSLKSTIPKLTYTPQFSL